MRFRSCLVVAMVLVAPAVMLADVLVHATDDESRARS